MVRSSWTSPGEQEVGGSGPRHEFAREVLLRAVAKLDHLSPVFVVIVGLLLLALIGLIDAVTGPFTVAVFYLLPVGLVTYSRGRWIGAAMAAAAAAAWGCVELATGVTDLQGSVTYWNFLTRFYMFEAVSLLVAPMRDVVLWERDLAAREADAAEQLRALSELRDALQFSERNDTDRRAPSFGPAPFPDGAEPVSLAGSS